MQRTLSPKNPPQPVQESQAPDWLAQVILNPPAWINQSLKALAALVAVAVAYRLYQRGFELGVSTQIEMQRVVTHVLGVMVATLACLTYLDLAFQWNVTAGVLIGVSSAFASQAVAGRIPHELISNNARERVMAGWAGLAMSALFFPELAGIQQSGFLAINARWYVLLLSIILALYNGALVHREKQMLDG